MLCACLDVASFWSGFLQASLGLEAGQLLCFASMILEWWILASFFGS